jgi:hypothetical protein
LRTNLKSYGLPLLPEVRTLNKRIAYGVIAALVLVAVIGGVLAAASAQSTNNETYSKSCIAPLGLKVGAWFKWRWGVPSKFVEVSPGYNQTVMSVLQLNAETSNLLGQGYKVVSVRPIVKAYVQGDGTVVFKAQQALVVLSNGSTMITYLVDINSKTVTHIATINVSALKELSGPHIRSAEH